MSYFEQFKELFLKNIDNAYAAGVIGDIDLFDIDTKEAIKECFEDAEKKIRRKKIREEKNNLNDAFEKLFEKTIGGQK